MILLKPLLIIVAVFLAIIIGVVLLTISDIAIDKYKEIKKRIKE